jgi:hypothetical protein
MSPVKYNPRQIYARGRCGYAGGMDFYPVGRWVGQGTAGPVWRAYCECGWSPTWVWSQARAVDWVEEHRQTGNQDIGRFKGPLNPSSRSSFLRFRLRRKA